MSFYNIYKIINDTLYYRGYKRTAYYDIDQETFDKLSKNDITILTELREDFENDYYKPREEQIMVFFPQEDKLRVTSLRNIKDIMKEKNIKRALVVTKNGITPAAQKELVGKFKKIEIFKETDFLTDITKHVLVPKHKIITKKEREEILKKYSLNELPKILESDPQIRRIGGQKEDIIYIERLSETAGLSDYWRLVV